MRLPLGMVEELFVAVCAGLMFTYRDFTLWSIYIYLPVPVEAI